VIFGTYKMSKLVLKSLKTKKAVHKKNKLENAEFRDLQVEPYGESVLLKDGMSSTNHSVATPKSLEVSTHHSATTPKRLVVSISESEDLA
jgi:hypothetical protein